MTFPGSKENLSISCRKSKPRFRPFLLTSFLLLLLGCIPLSPRPSPPSSETEQGCQQFFDQLEEKVKGTGVREASSFPVPGFPYLRTNRFLSAMRARVKEAEQKEQWLQWMKELDLQAREAEISNLPDESVRLLWPTEAAQPDRKGLYRRVKTCSDALLSRDRAFNGFNASIDSRMGVPEEYSFWRRAVGFYPLMVIPVAIASHNALVKTRSWFEMDLQDFPVAGKIRGYGPAKTFSLDEKTLQATMDESRRNPLRVPLPADTRKEALAVFFSPVIFQDVASSRDRVGRVVWKDGHIQIDPERPTVYYYFSHAFLKGEPVLQINYVFWYSERAGESSPWIERGRVDGLTLRVSLDLRGKPFMVDVMNNCGCYHFFAPAQDRAVQILSRPFGPDPFVPQRLPAVPSGNQLGVRITSGWHRAVRLLSVEEVADSIPYELVPYDNLKALPHEMDGTKSLFDGKGIVKGSQRPERFILFSMGIPQIGSMREQGHHAIDLIHRVTFDDPHLFDQNFVFNEKER
jgi:hypothetical protein